MPPLTTQAITVKRTREEALQTRQHLLEAALEVFHARGVARASLDEIARTAGVTRGALYWHFRNKEDLFDALCQAHFKDIRAKLSCEDGAVNPQAWNILIDSCIAYYRRLVDDPVLCKFAAVLHLKCEATPGNEGILRVLASHRDIWRQHLRMAIQSGQRHGMLPADLDPDLAQAALMSSLFGLTSLWLSEPQRLDMRRCAEPLVRACADMLSQSPHLRRPL